MLEVIVNSSVHFDYKKDWLIDWLMALRTANWNPIVLVLHTRHMHLLTKWMKKRRERTFNYLWTIQFWGHSTVESFSLSVHGISARSQFPSDRLSASSLLCTWGRTEWGSPLRTFLPRASLETVSVVALSLARVTIHTSLQYRTNVEMLIGPLLA